MPQVRLQRATIEYRVLGPDDSAHPPVLFVHGILVDHRLWMNVAEESGAQRVSLHPPRLAAGVAHHPGRSGRHADTGHGRRDGQRLHRRAGPA